MKRVGNKPAQLVRSASRRRKSSSRFQFDITIDKVLGAKPNVSYIVKWTRGVKVASTKPVLATKETSGKSALPIAQKLSLIVTLYRDDGARFDSKDAKLSLIAVHPSRKQERTAAKIHFDLSTLAGVPSASTPKLFKLSDRFSIRATVDARFIKTASGPGSAGASSALSRLSGVSARTSDDDEHDGEDDDFGDLALDDVPDPVPSARQKKPAPAPKPGPSSSSSASASASASSATPVLPAHARSAPAPPAAAGPPIQSRATPSPNPIPIQKEAHASSARPRVPLVTETPDAAASPVVSEWRKPPSPPPSALPSAVSSPRTSAATPPRAESPKPGALSPLHQFKQGKSSPAVATATPPLVASPEDEARIKRLSAENDRLFADLKRAREDSRMLRDSHKRDVDALNSQLQAQTQEALKSDSKRDSVNASLSQLKEERKEMEEKVKALTTELQNVTRAKDALAKENKSLPGLESKNRELSHEVDRLTIAAASGGGAAREGDQSEFEKRLTQVRQEKEALQRKLKAHESHSAKVRETYQKLSQMYNDLREHNTALQNEIDQSRDEQGRRNESDAGERDDLLGQLDDARQDIDDLEADKEALQSDNDRLSSQMNALQERLDNTSRQLEDSQREVEDLYEETEDLKGQRDMAMQRALSRGKSMTANEEAATRSAEKVEEELRICKEKNDREQARLARRIAELEQEVVDLREDIEYEKAEKLKARTERDNFRNNARTLERKTSLAAKQSDAMSSLKRQISTHQMRQQDHESMITELKSEVSRLEVELDHARSAFNDRRSSNAEELGEVLQDLVTTKMALAQAEDDKLHLQFSMKELRKSEKAIQQRLAEHASRLEVKLGEANEELEKLRKQQQLEDATEFNELGSDVDY